MDLLEPTSSTLVDPHIIALEAPFEPTPSYDSCNPISNNHFTGDDSNHMPFLPLADDPSFDWKEHCENYRYFAWQTRFFDSDLHAIVVETARRLHQQHGLSYSQIDSTGVLPLSLTAGQDGVLRTIRYQGSFDWAGVRDDRSKISPVPVVPVQVGFKALVSQFCNSASCMIGFCDQHINWFPMPLPLPVSPHLPSDDLFADIISPCGDNCFVLRVPGNVPAIETEWTQNDLDTFNTILEYSPDSSPCDLATICKKPCFEIFKKRKSTIPDNIIKRRPLDNNIKRPSRLKHTINSPCHHKGPCNITADCVCFRNKAHCERSCRCDPKTCRRRWAGCNCVRTKTRRPCGTERCACFKAHRECDPELCGKCQFPHDGCSNVSIQRQCWKSTEVKPGSWGVGLFLLQSANAGELITEYTGELVYEPTTESREQVSSFLCKKFRREFCFYSDVSRHRQRNYLFNLNATFALDSEFIGNESRYINHSKESPNCRAQVMMVNGDHRIGIYAQIVIAKGTELFLDYGTEFFRAT
ncbi:hypothetical protein J3R30DRAFT_3282052 [Lentinula aciculospora]|uniref:SET domain-containing protein n=1 Tax=Lentinula aciculospora TaxID=153920 RepID=A0A9W9AQ95_9AGAR|nr:hypothetical protein J3R30DRAFT_3282052 [Lentinula aciculospora]